jgi:hypothetical protein
MAIPKKWFVQEERARMDRNQADAVGDRAAAKRHQAAMDEALAKQDQHKKK